MTETRFKNRTLRYVFPRVENNTWCYRKPSDAQYDLKRAAAHNPIRMSGHRINAETCARRIADSLWPQDGSIKTDMLWWIAKDEWKRLLTRHFGKQLIGKAELKQFFEVANPYFVIA